MKIKKKSEDTTLQSLYCNHMSEIKARLALVISISDLKCSLGSDLHDYEVISLNLRKILELIAFASLVANKEKYANAHKSFEREWRAKQILDKLSELHPKFYPHAIKMKRLSNNGIHMDPVDVSKVLTQDEFGELYETCSKVLHTRNPFAPSSGPVNFRLSIQEWVTKIQLLLENHSVELVDKAGYWVVQMTDPSFDGNPATYTLRPVQGPITPPTNRNQRRTIKSKTRRNK